MSCRNQIPYKMVGAMPMDGLALGRPATMFAHEMPRLRNRDDSNGPGRPLRQTGHHRRVRQLPGVLVRSVRELLQLWGVHQSGTQLYLSLLPHARLHARYEAAAADARAAQKSRGASADGSSASFETRFRKAGIRNVPSRS